MHAVLVNVSIDPDHVEEVQTRLETDVVPRVKEAPGVISGYWMRSSDGAHGSAVTVFESEEAARAASEMVRDAATSDFVHMDSVEVREVVAHV